MAFESIAHEAEASWAIDSEPIRTRGIIVKYLTQKIRRQTFPTLGHKFSKTLFLVNFYLFIF